MIILTSHDLFEGLNKKTFVKYLIQNLTQRIVSNQYMYVSIMIIATIVVTI